jgi:hypothetical protein
MVRISAKGIVPPGGVDRIFAGMAQTAQARLVLVADSMRFQRGGHYFGVVLRIPAGFRDSPDVYEIVDPVSGKHRKEFLERMRGVTDGVDNAADTFRIVA